MVTLHIEHAITDYATWKQAFDRFAGKRTEAGVLRHRIHRPVGDPAYVVIELEFGTAEQAARFLEFLSATVWSTPSHAPALVGRPVTRIQELVEQS